MKLFRFSIPVIIAVVCFAFTINKNPIQTGCDQTNYWFRVTGLQVVQAAAIINLQAVATTFGDVNPNEVPSGSRALILVSTFSYCAITEDYYCALGFAASQLEVRQIPAGSGSYYWIPKNGEIPRCVIFKVE